MVAVNPTLLHVLFVVVPLGTAGLLAAVAYSRKGTHPATYSMSQPWTHAPILWAATDESIPGGHHGHGDSVLSVGGGASGRW